jgi:aryl-alcohol dehydrogenase-like predicted oxidoreductase
VERRARRSARPNRDAANVYSGGASEGVLGRVLRDFARREEMMVATKVYGVMRPQDPNGRDCLERPS